MFKRRRSADDFAEEIKSHFELEADELQSEGLSEEEARHRARVEFGNAQAAQERFYLRSRIVWFDNLLHDIKFAIRQLIRNPSFASVAIVTLALGIAANSTVFSWINSTLLDPIPGIAHTSDMITIMRGERSEHPTPPFSYLDFADLRDRTQTLSGLLAYHDDYMAITGSDKPERVYGTLASSNYFEVLGVRPILGQTLQSTAPNERLGTAEAVLSYGLWQKHFGADPSIIGKTVEINLHPYTIVGVAPEGFQGCKSGLQSDLWIPLGMESQVWGSDRIKYRDTLWLNVLGKLQPGVDHHQAEKELNILMQHIAEQFPDAHQGPNMISSDPLWRSPFGVNVYLSGTLPILLALALVLLLLACANVANLLLVHSVARRREFAIRLSMGASRRRLVLQLMVENVLIALAGGGLALLLTMWTAHGLSAFLPATTLPLSLNGSVDRTVLVATIMISLLTAVVSGVVPALRASSLSPVSALKDEALNSSAGIHKSRLAGALVVGQIALSLLLLVCAGLFVRSLQSEQSSDPGFDPNHVFLAYFDLRPVGYSRAQGIQFDRQMLVRLKSLPGVQSVTVGDFAPLSFSIRTDFIQPEGYVPRKNESMEVDRGVAGPEYLRTVRTALLAGRDFTDRDDAGAQPVSIVNKALADRYWQGQDALGKRLQVAGHWTTVVGVAANAKYRRLVYDAAPLVLIPMLQSYRTDQVLYVRVAGDPLSYASSVERTVHGLNSDLPLFNETTLAANMQLGNAFERIEAAFAGSFGLLALILAAIGVYGVVAYATKQRTHEIGIRIALGAGKQDIFRQVLGRGLRLAGFGVVLGLMISFALTRYLRGMLYGVGTADWLTFVIVAILLCVITLIACFVPARRAASVDPMQALRTE
ncbi:ABC transporter permease [Terracidiphilus gabretensis]|uniref:ABC transporter permease n=1 Tax=Terracidiphilus gabretensis TaxID=1577687 RepID=UPI00071B78CC|nr:ABC transporter permease [Terracidiphilus gabretensis]